MAKINGIEIYYEVHGEGDPLLLIAGYGHHSLIWQNVVDELSKKNRVILFDNRGMGRSEVLKPPYTIEEMAQDAIALLTHLQIEKPTSLATLWAAPSPKTSALPTPSASTHASSIPPYATSQKRAKS